MRESRSASIHPYLLFSRLSIDHLSADGGHYDSVSRISASGIVRMSFESTVRSAKFPGEREPLMSSSKAAYAGWSVYIFNASIRLTFWSLYQPPSGFPSESCRVTAAWMPQSGLL
jgi:hypothetical protein